MSVERRRAVIEVVRRQFRLDWHGIHGAAHWARVRLNGLTLARRNGARADIVELFALLHDSQRRDDGRDRHHGARAADYVRLLNRDLLRLDPFGLDQLAYACRHHSNGLIEADITVQTCWDADRLDLGRIGVRPDPLRLCTPDARQQEVLERALRRSLR